MIFLVFHPVDYDQCKFSTCQPSTSCIGQANTLRPYLNAIRGTLDAALCLRNFPSQTVERHNKPEIETRYSIDGQTLPEYEYWAVVQMVQWYKWCSAPLTQKTVTCADSYLAQVDNRRE